MKILKIFNFIFPDFYLLKACCNTLYRKNQKILLNQEKTFSSNKKKKLEKHNKIILTNKNTYFFSKETRASYFDYLNRYGLSFQLLQER